MNAIEEKLWNYIDGTCTADEHASISHLIENDALYQQKYNELIRFNTSLAAIELDEPSMGFTYHILETIRTENALKPLRANINRWIIRGIAAFFVVPVSLLLIFMLFNINWSAGGSSEINFHFTMPRIPNYINSTAINAFVFVDMIMALFLLDNYLRKKLVKNTAQ